MANEEKIEELQEILREDPQNFQARRELAILLIDAGFPKEAAQHLLYLAKTFPDDSAIYYNLGIAYEKQKEFKKAMTRSNLYKFWGKVAGAKFAGKSKPYSMMSGGVMVIACESPTVAQELMLKKTQLLIRFKPYLESLKMNVKDLRFDTKKWQP